MPVETTLIYVATFLSVAGAVAAVASWWQHNPSVDARVAKLRSSRAGRVPDPALDAPQTWFQSFCRRFVDTLLPASSQQEMDFKRRCLQAGLYHPGSVQFFLVMRYFLVILPAAMTIFFLMSTQRNWDITLLIGLMACGIAMLAPGFWLDWKKKKRQLALSKTLPDFLDLLVTCLEGGLSLEGGLKRVTVELKYAHPVLASELARMQQEIDFGATPEAATANFAERTDLESLKTLSTFLQQSRKFGSSITEALRSHSEMMRDNREMRAEEMAQKAAVKILFPTLVLIFPAVFTVLAGPAAIQLAEKFGK